jgi:hypothetical protein
MLSAIVAVLVVMAGFQSAPARSSGGGNAMISPTVVATWITDRVEKGPVQLRLLVLWRGTPGWYFLAGSRIADSFDGVRTEQTFEYGNLRLTLH